MSTRHVNTTLQEQADALFDELSSALRHAPDDPAQALHTLRVADRAFDALHTWLRAGGPLPSPGRLLGSGKEHTADRATRQPVGDTTHQLVCSTACEDVLDTATGA